MALAERARPVSPTTCPTCASVQWHESLEVVIAHMDATASDEVFVLQGDRLVGRIRRWDVEHLQEDGNWPGCIAAVDAMDRNVPCRTPDSTPTQLRALLAAAGVRQLAAIDAQGRFAGVVADRIERHAGGPRH